ncbi:hypothetical protein ACHAXR_005409 [Thalassiosira sp. AJA248-18]
MNSKSIMLDPDLLNTPVLHHVHRRPNHDRLLGSNDNFQSLLVDKHGNEYDPYSLAWRYLGLYMDCDVNDANAEWNQDNDNDMHRRRLPGEDDEGGQCQRKVLWAAYVDPRYKGNTIEEYEFYDLASGEWDDSACLASGKRHRCARMDCHEPHTHFKLVGVFKETDGMYDFTEQLFKHEGYCVWGNDDDDDTYETMETWMERWPTSCTELNNRDYYGNTLYIDVQPLPEGNMTLGIYTDEKCTTISPYIDLSSYIENLYYSYYGSYDYGTEVAEMYNSAISTWNEKMSTFKVCQPCRAYNLFSENNEHSGDHRLLGEDNDGEGEAQERYNCYDDAGYTNCWLFDFNTTPSRIILEYCSYKFETHTSMEAAEGEDLSMASAQGSILRIKANGRNYGKGGYVSPMSTATLRWYISLAAIAVVALTTLVHFFLQRRFAGRKRVEPNSLKETFNVDADNTEAGAIGKENMDATTSTCNAIDSNYRAIDTASDTREIEIGTIRPQIQTILDSYSALYNQAKFGVATHAAARTSDIAYVSPRTDFKEIPESTSCENPIVSCTTTPIESVSSFTIGPTVSTDSASAMLIDLGLVKRQSRVKAPTASAITPSLSQKKEVDTVLLSAASTCDSDYNNVQEGLVADLDSATNDNIDSVQANTINAIVSMATVIPNISQTNIAESTSIETRQSLGENSIEDLKMEPLGGRRSGEATAPENLVDVAATASIQISVPESSSIIETKHSDGEYCTLDHNVESPGRVLSKEATTPVTSSIQISVPESCSMIETKQSDGGHCTLDHNVEPPGRVLSKEATTPVTSSIQISVPESCSMIETKQSDGGHCTLDHNVEPPGRVLSKEATTPTNVLVHVASSDGLVKIDGNGVSSETTSKNNGEFNNSQAVDDVNRSGSIEDEENQIFEVDETTLK